MQKADRSLPVWGIISSLVVLVLWTQALPARANVAELRNVVASEPSLLHQYTFEGDPALGQHLEDSAGTADLVEMSTGAGSTANLIYAQGYDASTIAFTPECITWSNGAALSTTADIATPTTMTVEAIVAPQNHPENNGGYAVTTRPTTNQRGYFIATADGTPNDSLGTVAGANSSDFKTTVSPFEPGHWYYVCNTYDTSSGSSTIINSYVADITEGQYVLDHPVVDAHANGTYGSSSKLAIGHIARDNWFFSGAIDEVAVYDGTLAHSAIAAHLDALLSTPNSTLVYRETFPNDAATAARPFPAEGWDAHYSSAALHTANGLVEEWNTAFDADLPPVNCRPTDTSVTQGYLNNHSGPTADHFLYWTEEFTTPDLLSNRIDTIGFDTRFNSSTYRASVALRVDVAGTPDDISDDAWFASADFGSGTGEFAHTAGGNWQTHLLDFADAEWVQLSFTPGSVLALGTTQVDLPAGAQITAFGIYQNTQIAKTNARYDNFEITVTPEPTTLSLLAIGGFGMLVRRRKSR